MKTTTSVYGNEGNLNSLKKRIADYNNRKAIENKIYGIFSGLTETETDMAKAILTKLFDLQENEPTKLQENEPPKPAPVVKPVMHYALVKAYFDRGISESVFMTEPDCDIDELCSDDYWELEGVFCKTGGINLENLEVYDADTGELIFDLSSLSDDERDEINDSLHDSNVWDTEYSYDVESDTPLVGVVEYGDDFVLTCRINCEHQFDIRKLKLLPAIIAEWSRDGDDGHTGFIYDGKLVLTTDEYECNWHEVDSGRVKLD